MAIWGRCCRRLHLESAEMVITSETARCAIAGQRESCDWMMDVGEYSPCCIYPLILHNMNLRDPFRHMTSPFMGGILKMPKNNHIFGSGVSSHNQ